MLNNLLEIENLITLLNLEKEKMNKIISQFYNLNKENIDSFYEIIYISDSYILLLKNLLQNKEKLEFSEIEKYKIKSAFNYYKQLKEISSGYEIE